MTMTIQRETSIRKASLGKAGWRYSGLFLLGIMMVGLTACTTTLGPAKIKTDRFDYAAAVGDSWRSQTLLNIVKGRYLEWPLFMEVTQIITQYSQEHVGSISTDIRRPFNGSAGGSEFDIAKASYLGKYNERPTVIYTPMNGQLYALTMLTPISPAIVFGLLDAGWPADKVLRLGVNSINGLENSHVSFGFQYRASVEFADFLGLVRKLQQRNALVIKIEVSTQSAPPAGAVTPPQGSELAASTTPTPVRVPTNVEMIINRELLDDTFVQNMNEVLITMGLDPNLNRYKIVYNDDKIGTDTLAVESRSVLQILGELATYVQVPRSDIERGVLSELVPIPESNFSGFDHLMRIRSGPDEPTRAYAKVRYRNLWFWVDLSDHSSKRTFTFIAMLMNMVEPDIASQGPQVVTPVREDGMRPDSDEEDEEETEEES